MPSTPLTEITNESLCYEHSTCGVAVNYCLLRQKEKTDS